MALTCRLCKLPPLENPVLERPLDIGNPESTNLQPLGPKP